MGEKPMGTPLEDEELGPEAGAASIITTRSNIKSSGAIKFETADSHSTLAHVVQTPQGVAA